MADVTARSVEPQSTGARRRAALRVVAGSSVAPSERLPMLAPPSSRDGDILGIGPTGWLGALAVYAFAAVALLLAWRATPPEAWPEAPARFRVVFEEPAAPRPEPAVSEPAPSPETAVAEPTEALEPPLPAPAPEPPPPPTVAESSLPVEVPPPPPPKPVLRHALNAAPAMRPAPAAPAPSTAAPSPQPTPQIAAVPVLPPRPISGLSANAKPAYPAEARRLGMQGRVVLRVDVSAAGLPLGVSVAASSGHEVLDRAARAAVERWRFNPATQAGVPVAGTADVPVQFRLED